MTTMRQYKFAEAVATIQELSDNVETLQDDGNLLMSIILIDDSLTDLNMKTCK